VRVFGFLSRLLEALFGPPRKEPPPPALPEEEKEPAMPTPPTFNDEVKAHLKRWEGGYVFHPADPGGETVCGIARRFHPAWPGWERVDAVKAKNPDNHRQAVDLILDDLWTLAFEIYQRDYWARVRASEFLDHKLAENVFDTAVNMGVDRSLRMLQKAVGAKVDGVIGPMTLAAANAQPGAAVVFGNARITRYHNLVAADASRQVFLKGWIARATSFPHGEGGQ
jgi:lysozyme family protein